MPMPVSRTETTHLIGAGGRPRAQMRPPRFGVLGAVRQQVAEHLGEARQVAVDVDRLGRQRDRQRVTRGLDQRAGGLDGAVDDVGQQQSRAAQLHLVPADPRDVQQVVHQPHHVRELPLHHRAGAAPRRRRRPSPAG